MAFTFRTLIEKGSPLYAQYYADVDRVEIKGPRAVTFFFKPDASLNYRLFSASFRFARGLLEGPGFRSQAWTFLWAAAIPDQGIPGEANDLGARSELLGS